jgi:glycogen operon protein
MCVKYSEGKISPMSEEMQARSQLGVSVSNGVGTIGVYSENATSIELCIFEPDDVTKLKATVELTRGDANIWSGQSDLLVPGANYALRADGPKAPRNAFNNTLFLIDPYARGVVRQNAREYHCVVVDDSFDWQGVEKPNIPLDELIVYEAHARGLTRGNSELPDELRGTYAALGHASTIAHLKKIGVNAVELLPIHMFISEPRLMSMGLINYWGYNSINFFSPHPRYATSSAWKKGPQAIIEELKTSIRELHRNGIEVILDVVYNHTAEGGGGGLTYSYRGLDNSSYYRMDDNGHFHDTTGCGNSLNFGNPQVVQLVLDSLKYWTTEMQVDGYRFDLGATLARNEINHFDPNHPLLRAIVEDPIFKDAKMIMEPWDVGLGGWQTGNFPDRFSEWNDRYRDDIRRFWLSDVAAARNSGKHWNGVADLATRLAGSRDIVDGPSGPMGSVNFITAHDGFCLQDLVSYDVKHNQMNGESNRDGTNGNHSFNHGHEGEGASEETKVQRRKAARNLMATLLFSSGIPMITAGDERLKTQNGNNNAYCQDTVMSWVNWDLNRHSKDFEETFAYLTRLRLENAVLRPKTFGDFNSATEEHDMVRWFNLAGEIMSEENWHDSECRTIQRYTERLESDGSRSAMLLVIHGAEKSQDVTLAAPDDVAAYTLLWNSALDVPSDEKTPYAPNQILPMSGTSIQLLKCTF